MYKQEDCLGKEGNKMKSKKYHSLNNSKIQQKNKKYHTEQLQDSTEKQKIPHCLNNSKIQQKNKKYHTV